MVSRCLLHTYQPIVPGNRNPANGNKLEGACECVQSRQGMQSSVCFRDKNGSIRRFSKNLIFCGRAVVRTSVSLFGEQTSQQTVDQHCLSAAQTRNLS
jgi:hypothetical protein